MSTHLVSLFKADGNKGDYEALATTIHILR